MRRQQRRIEDDTTVNIDETPRAECQEEQKRAGGQPVGGAFVQVWWPCGRLPLRLDAGSFGLGPFCCRSSNGKM